VKTKRVIWSERATLSLKDHYDKIKKDSLPAAKRVKSEIINASKELNNYPEKYQLDDYYPNNPGNIRRFFRWSYKIVYQINDETIDILNVLHTSQEPQVE
jgi:plasmid stabilization system protein ParE